MNKNEGDLGKIIVATCFEWLPKVQKIAQSGHTGHLNQTEKPLVGIGPFLRLASVSFYTLPHFKDLVLNLINALRS